MKYTPYLCFTMAILLQSQAIYAEDTIDDTNILTVTADFRESNLLDTTTSVTVLSEDVLEDAGEQHLEEVLSLISNLNWAGGSSRPRYFQIRGVGERSQYEGSPNPSVGVLIDDIDFSGIGMVATLYDIQQVEVLRGPQGARYGANALAGLINIKTRDPEKEGSVRGQFMAAEDGNWSAAVSGTGALDEEEQVTGLFSLQQFQGNGFRYNSYLNSDDTNGRDELSSRGKIHWQIDKRWNLALTGLYIDMDNGYDAWAIDNSLTTLSDKPGKDSQQSTAGAGRLTLDESLYQFVSISTFADSDIEHSFDGDWGNDDSWGVYGPYDFTSDNQRQRKSWSQEFRFKSTPEGALNNGKTDWLVGLYILDMEEDNVITEFYNGGLVREIDSSYEATNTAIFTEITQHLSNSMDLSVALRFENRDASYYDSESASFSPEDNMLGGNITLRQYHKSGFMGWVSISRGYKAGGFNISLSIPEELREYEPEFLWNYELGIKGKFLQDQLIVSSSLFYMDRQDMQILSSTQLDQEDPLTFIFFTENAAEGYNSGLETDIRYQINSDWGIEASFGLLDTKIESYEGLDQSLVGRDQAHSPSYSYALAVDYRDDNGWFGRLDFNAKDDFYYSSSHQQQSNAYQLLNMKVGYETEHWSIYFWGKNISDEIYHVRGFFFGNEPPNWYKKLYTQQGNPRQFGVTGRIFF
ncbi:MAG: TonB-dependent receptor [Gammaproteobacteria bacterium]|nr:TonB-dependent receptor [Gammaproteobacteria bacterium]